jgi:hypothetical protein
MNQNLAAAEALYVLTGVIFGFLAQCKEGRRIESEIIHKKNSLYVKYIQYYTNRI